MVQNQHVLHRNTGGVWGKIPQHLQHIVPSAKGAGRLLVQFDVLNSKIQEFRLNEMVCERNPLFIAQDLFVKLGST